MEPFSKRHCSFMYALADYYVKQFPKDRRVFFDELRFAKQQQFTITNYTLLLMAGVFAVAKVISPTTPGKIILCGLIGAAWAVGLVMLCDLQGYMREIRRRQTDMQQNFSPEDQSLARGDKPSGAKQAKVALLYGPEGVVVTIEDDGKGFDVEQTFTSAEGRGHFGVVGMRERAEAAGGQLVVRSEAGHGTIVRASIPYTNLAAVPGATSGPIEDVEQQPGVEDQDTSDKGFFTKLFGR